MMTLPSEKLTCRRQVNKQSIFNIMGYRSPKANQKKSGQKQSKTNNVAEVKKAAVLSKQAVGKKK